METQDEYFAYIDAVLAQRAEIEKTALQLVEVVPPKHGAILMRLLRLCSENSFMAL